MKPVSITTVSHSPAENEVKGKAEKKSGKRIGYNYIILKSLKESRKNDVVTCLYIKSLTNFGICVIKEGSYGDSKDKHGRDIKDRLRWQKQLHQQLQDKVRLPRLLGSFEENGNYYLVLERIRGKSLYKACREHRKDLREGLIASNKLGLRFLDYMIQMIRLLETLHRHQVIHRDVTATNFMITPAGKVAVIDMELSYSLEQQFPTPPFQLGTYGYMSPEQEATQMPAVEQDTFSVAAIMLHMWTGISPAKLTNPPYRLLTDRIRFLIPDRLLGDMIIECLHPDPALRPSLQKLRKAIAAYRDDLRRKINRPQSVPEKITWDEMHDTVQRAVGTLCSPLLTDKEKGWFSENPAIPKDPDAKSINKGWYASFYKGACGVMYTMSKAKRCGLDVSAAKPSVDLGIRLIESRYISRIQDAGAGLHFGGAGIAAVLATGLQAGLIEPQPAYFDWIPCLLENDSPALGFQSGIAGQGMAHWLCHPFLQAEKVDKKLAEYTGRLLDAQEKDGSWQRFQADKDSRATRGFARGVAGIVCYLLEYGHRHQHKDALETAQKGLRWLMEKSIRKKNTIRWRSVSKKEIAPWWCEGAPGISLAFLKAYTLLHEEKYREYAIGALSNHLPEVLENNLGQCHGLSGLGEIYLEAFRLLQDERWLEKAGWIAQVLMYTRKEHAAHGPYWLVDHERLPLPDFMTGNSGIVHYLLRYCYPHQVGFTLLP